MPGLVMPTLMCQGPNGLIGLPLQDGGPGDLAATYSALRDLMGRYEDRELTWYMVPAGERW